MIQILIVGSGSIAQRYHNILTQFSEISIQNYSRQNFFSNLNNTIQTNNERIFKKIYDLTIICSETKNHIPDLYKFLNVSRTILIEKPLYFKPLQANTIKKLENRRIYVSSQLRFSKAILELQKLILTLDEITGVNVTCKSWLPDWRPSRDFRDGYWNRIPGGGVLLELVHELDYTMLLFGELKLKGAVSYYSKELKLKVESSVDILCKNKRSIPVYFRLDFCSQLSERKIEINSVNSKIIWDLLKSKITTINKFGIENEIIYFDDQDRNNLFLRQLQKLLNLRLNLDDVAKYKPATLTDGQKVLKFVNSIQNMMSK